MRLLDTTTFELASNSPSIFKQEGYAILSHRWIGSEITFEQLGGYVDALRAAGDTPLESPQQDKIRGACQIARAKGIRWMWIDTCCIDKSSTAELSESLNSMFRWYRDAKLCITYLLDVIRKGAGKEDFTNEAGHPSVWFSRGWTLQELLAPRHLEFFDKNWDSIGNRAELAEQIEKITGIHSNYLKGETGDDFRDACIATKFSWIAKRQTERDEDMAYSMLGLFGVTMDPRYGEGWGAFMRLQKELLSSWRDESLFAWKMMQADAGLKLLSGVHTQPLDNWKENEWGLLAPHPLCFKDCGQMTATCPWVAKQYITRPEGGFQMRQQGLQITFGRDPFYPDPEDDSARTVWLTLGLTILCVATMGLSFMLHMCHAQATAVTYEEFHYTLNCWDQNEMGNMVPVRIWLRVVNDDSPKMRFLKRVRCTDVMQGREGLMPGPTQFSGIVLQPWTLAS